LFVKMSDEMPGTANEHDVKSLPQDVETCHEVILSLLETLGGVEQRCEQLEHRLDVLLRQRFGPSAERLDSSQLQLFAREVLQTQGEETPEAPSTTVREHARRNGRRKLPEDLPRLRVEYDLTDEERCCPECQEPRRKIGEETSEQLEYEPAKVHVIEHVRMKYACPKCEGHLVTAPKARQAIEKCLAGPGLLAQVAVSKYSDHMPLHRLERIFKRHGIEISRSTMCDSMRLTAEALEPLRALMQKEVHASKVVHTDDTPVPVQEKGRGKTRQGRFWVYVGDETHRYAVFDYTPTRSRAGPESWLKGFEGYLQADAYAGYEVLYATGKVVEVACWAHARRKFYDARMTDPGRCHQAMAWIKRLYAVERESKERFKAERNKENGPSLASIREELRRGKSILLLEQFKEWLDRQSREVLPKSPTAEAIQYVRTRWPSFTRYTTKGILAIDNNISENALRAVALGRKNWLFAGSDRGGCAAAVLFSMLASCRLNNVEPWSWMRDVLRRIPDITVKELPELLPDRWQASQNASEPAATGSDPQP
jgi:transposase